MVSLKISKNVSTYFYLISLIITVFSCSRKDEAQNRIVPVKEELPRTELYEVEISFDISSIEREVFNRLAIEVISYGNGLVVMRDWLTEPLIESSNDLDQNNVSLALSKLPLLERGYYQIRLFVENQITRDSGGLPVYQGCPEPFSLRDPLNVLAVDTLSAKWSGLITRDQSISLTLKEHTCGPGDPSTTLSGWVSQPEDEQLQLYLHLEPIPTLEEVSGLGPLSFPLTLKNSETIAFDDVDETLQNMMFELTQLPRGRYRATVFTDDDQNAQPSYCDLERGVGGDRWRGNSVDIFIERGDQVVISDLFSIQLVEACDQLVEPIETNVNTQTDPRVNEIDPSIRDTMPQKSAFTGQLNLTSELLDALYISGGSVWFSYTQRTNPPYRFVQGKRLFGLKEALLANGRFTIHLPHDTTTDVSPLAFWLERGSDEMLVPCDDLEDPGMERLWWEGTTEQLTPLSYMTPNPSSPVTNEDLFQFNSQPLSLLQRCPPPESVLRGEVRLPENDLSLWLERPLILSLENLFTGKIRQGVIADIEEDQLGQRVYFERRVEPGTYQYSVYLDQDESGRFNPCGLSNLGDLWSTPDGFTSLSQNEVINPLDLQLSRLLCIASESIPVFQLPKEAITYHTQSDSCDVHQVLIQVSQRGDTIFGTQCKDIDELRQVQLPSLSAGSYDVEVCVPLDTSLSSWDSNSTDQNHDCDAPRFLSTLERFQMSQYPRQVTLLELTPQCDCGLSIP